ncbi:MAG: alpha/beta hydrolase [Acidobacteria bacterium]|nr:MAG: alpha/beta hydrolase [Acidobacteriota bacterium]
MSKRRIIRNIVLVLLVLAALFFLIVVPWFLTSIITQRRFHFHDRNDGKTPQSYGLDYQPIEFHSSDGIELKGWYVPAGPNARGTIIYCHGLNRTRIEMLPMEVYGHSLGYNGLLFDFRHSGESSGTIGTLGYQERLDAIAAAHHALDYEKAARPIIYWGVSMGASASLMAAADTPDVAAVISDSSFLSYSHVIAHHARLFFHLPAFPIVDEVIYWSAWRGGFWPSEFDLRNAVGRINPRPILFIAVEGDRRITPEVARELYSHSTSPGKAILVVPGRRHGEGFTSGQEPYERAVKDFLASLLR